MSKAEIENQPMLQQSHEFQPRNGRQAAYFAQINACFHPQQAAGGKDPNALMGCASSDNNSNSIGAPSGKRVMPFGSLDNTMVQLKDLTLSSN